MWLNGLKQVLDGALYPNADLVAVVLAGELGENPKGVVQPVLFAERRVASALRANNRCLDRAVNQLLGQADPPGVGEGTRQGEPPTHRVNVGIEIPVAVLSPAVGGRLRNLANHHHGAAEANPRIHRLDNLADLSVGQRCLGSAHALPHS